MVYQDDGSYIEYSYQDGTKNIGEASVQVEYIGTADVSALGDGNVEYVTLTGEQPIRDQYFNIDQSELSILTIDRSHLSILTVDQ